MMHIGYSKYNLILGLGYTTDKSYIWHTKMVLFNLNISRLLWHWPVMP